MAQVPPALDPYLQNVLLIADINVRNAILGQGINDFNAFRSLKDDDIRLLCANIRRPGGTILNPLAGGREQPPRIPNPGLSLGHVLEMRLKMLCYFVNHLVRVQRQFDPAIATLAKLAEVYQLKDLDDPDDDIPLPARLMRADQARETIEDIEDYLLRKRGASGCPLAAVIRMNVALPLPEDDPGFGQPTYLEEMIQRMPHVGTDYQTDNRSVWDLIRHICHGGPAWDWVSQFARNSDGRSAHIALKTHYLGETFQALIRAQADKRLENAYFDGMSRNFTFESYCTLLQHSFTDLEAAGDPISESRKVRCFLKGIRDPRLHSCKDVIVGTPALSATFDSASTYATRIIAELISLSEARGRNVSSVRSGRGRNQQASNQSKGGGSGGRGGRGGRGRGGRGHCGRLNQSGRGISNASITDRYYKPDEWRALTPEQQEQVRKKREDRDQRRGVQAVGRSVRPRVAFGDESEPVAVISPPPDNNQQDHGIGAVMSRRRNNNPPNASNN
jgi:hypothetical protein